MNYQQEGRHQNSPPGPLDRWWPLVVVLALAIVVMFAWAARTVLG